MTKQNHTQQSRPSLLTREEELELARALERGERAVAEAIARSRPALEELERRLQDEADGSFGAAPVLRATFRERCERTRACRHLLELTERVRASSAQPSARAVELERTRAALVAGLLRYGLHPQLVSGILAQLRGAQRTAGASKARSLAATTLAIERGRDQADRARASFIEANQGLVVLMASRRCDNGLALADLVQEGNLGLMRAADKFDHRRGLRFSTYAAWWIRHALNRALSDQSRTIRIPVNLLETEYKLRRRASAFAGRTGEEPPEHLVLADLRIAPARLARVRAIPKEPQSFDRPIGPDGDRRLGDTIADERTPSPLDVLSLAEAGKNLQQMLGILTPREREILSLRFGLDGSEEATLAQIGQRFSLSRERIRQIELEALHKLRRATKAHDAGTTPPAMSV